MITEWLVDFALSLVAGVASLLPDIELDMSGVAGVFGTMLSFDGVAPIAETLAVGSLLLSIWGSLFLWRGLRMLLSHVPWIGGSG